MNLSPDNYRNLDATALAELVRYGDVAPHELAEAALETIEALNADLNAVVFLNGEDALAAARKMDLSRPFAGVPMLLKDLGTSCRGFPATQGSRLLRDAVSTFDSTLVARYREAGFVILGMTNTPEFGLNATTEPALFGPTRNPWQREHIAGGSSGGSAAAVAAGMTPLAHATDSAGSIRIPAACCGLFGLKPSRGRMPMGPVMGERNGGISTAHVLTRSVRDSAAVLDNTAGREPGSPYSAPLSTGFYADAANRHVDGLTVAVAKGFPLDRQVAPPCERVVDEAARLLEEMGVVVVEAEPEIDFSALREALAVLFACHLAAGLRDHERRSLEEGLEPLTLALVNHGLSLGALDYVAAVESCHRAARRLGEFFETYDAMLTPALAMAPPRLGWLSTETTNWSAHLAEIFDFVGYMPLFNATGTPAAVLPIDRTRDGLPIAVHLGAALGREDVLLTIAAALERCRTYDSDRMI